MTYRVVPFVTQSASPELTLERILTAGDGITLTDSGAGGALTIAASGAGITYQAGDISNPPTQAELTTLIGSPITIGAGKAYYLNDVSGHAREYLALSDGFYWWVLPLAKTAYTELNSAVATNAADYLTTPTYDGSGQTVHPDVYYNAAGWNGYKYWMAMTPYPNQNAAYENPSILTSNDGDTWAAPAGLTNPVQSAPPTGYYSDPDLIVTPAGVMWMFYRFGYSVSNEDSIYARSTSDGITWSDASLLITSTYTALASPAVIYDGAQYVMWSVKVSANPNILEKRTCATPGGTWSAPSTCTVNNAPSGKDIWHLDVVKRGRVYHGFFVFCDANTNGSNSLLYFGYSTDGATWTIGSSVLLSPAVGQWDAGFIYRASGIPTAAGYDLFYSAGTGTNANYIGRTTVTMS